MKYRLTFIAALIAAIAWLAQPSVDAQDKKDKDKQPEEKEVVVNSELNNGDLKDKVLTQSYSKTYVYKMTQGHRYQIDMISKAFDAYLRLEDPKGTQVAADDDGGGMLNSRIIYTPNVTGDFTICAMSLGGGSTGKFTLIVRDLTAPGVKVVKNDGKPIELKNDKGKAAATATLNANDPMYMNKKHKLFHFNMEEGKTYQIDMTSDAFDSYLFLEDADGKLLARDDDGGGFPSARITIKANKTGKHRIIATHFGGGGNLGEFMLSIRQTDGPAPDEKKDAKKDAKDER
jgi:hypothetical protein